MNYIKEAENILWHYNDLYKSLANLDKQISKLVRHAQPSELNAISLEPTGVHGSRDDNTYNMLFELQTLTDSRDKTVRDLEEINKLLDDISIDAYAKWKEITKIYKDIDFVSSGDTGLLARYCMTFSEYLRLLDQRKRIERFEVDYERLEEHFDPELLEGLDAFFKFNPVMQLDSAINKKMDMLIKMEDRLFLNPLAKVKNVPKKEPKDVDPLAKKGFGNI